MTAQDTQDPYLYLEEVESAASLQFATEANGKCLSALGDPSKTETYERVLAALTSDERIPHVTMMGWEEGEMLLYNFWRDGKVSSLKFLGAVLWLRLMLDVT